MGLLHHLLYHVHGSGTPRISKRQPAIAFLFILRERSKPFSFNKNPSAYLIIARRTVFSHMFVNRRFHTLGGSAPSCPEAFETSQGAFRSACKPFMHLVFLHTRHD